MSTQPSTRFLHLAKTTLVFVYLVIIAGSIVRATGSGMGCPDWPRCFGRWIPPTDVSQLPPDYRSYFKVQEQSIAPFNALQTWTEYGNRLIGATLGLLMFAQLIMAFLIRKNNPGFFKKALLVLVLTGMEGVLGAIVVYTNLHTGVITLHMFLSLVILVVQSRLVFQVSSTNSIPASNPYLRRVVLIALVLTTLQILLGTQVRESVDVLLKNFDEARRGDILNNVDARFLIHGLSAWMVLLLNVFVFIKLKQDKPLYALVKPYAIGMGAVILLEMGAGYCLKQYALPPLIQPAHLLLASLLFGIQLALLMRIRKA